MRQSKNNEDFLTFWDAYALKRDRIAAERAWKKLSAKDRKSAMEGVGRYKQDCEKRGINRMYAQGYLTHRRWEDEECAEEDKSTATAVAESAPVAPSPVRTGDQLTAQDLQAFAAMKEQLLQAWSRHKDEANAVGLRKLMDGLELHGVNDFHKMVQFRSVRTTFNREFTVPWFWEPNVFDSIVAECFNGYRWVATI